MGLVSNIDQIFINKDTGKQVDSLNFVDFMDTVLQMRGSNFSTMKDIVEIRKLLQDQQDKLMKRLDMLEKHFQFHTSGNGESSGSASCEKDPLKSQGQEPSNVAIDASTTPFEIVKASVETW